MSDAEEVKFSLKVMINKEKTRVLFAESDSHFTNILLSFLTLPLGRIINVLEKHYGDESPTIGSLNSLCHGLANLDSSHFWTEGAKLILLNPTSSFDSRRIHLKLNISDFKPDYFVCEKCVNNKFWSVSIYYDQATTCKNCGCITMKRYESKEVAQAGRTGGLIIDGPTFIMTDDLQIVPNAIGLVQTISTLDIAGMDNAELMDVTFGLSEIMNLLKASMISQTPLSDLLLGKTRETNSVAIGTKPRTSSLDQIRIEETQNSKKMMVKVLIQKSTNKLLFAQANEDFVEFLFSLLAIPIGGVECLLESKTSIKSIDNLYRSVSVLIDDKYFKTLDLKNRLVKPKLPHGYVSKIQILPLTEEILPDFYKPTSLFSSVNFPQGQGQYMKGSRTYQVLDDLTVIPFYISSIVCGLNQQMIPVSDVQELEVEVGLEEALSILKASLTSNSALTNGLLSHISNRQPKQET